MNRADKSIMPKVLGGVKVLAFIQGIAGPLAAVLLASYGAKVVRIESKHRLDWHRQNGPFLGGIRSPDRSLSYLVGNGCQNSITLNIKHPQSPVVVDHLVRWADVIVENFAGGVMDRMGLSYERLRAIRPDIIVISASIFGQTGPYSSARGYGGTLTALTGIPHISGFPDQPPQFPAFAITDYISPRIAMLAVISALDYRRRTGKGQYLDAAQVESTLAMMGPIFLNFQANGIEAVRMGNRSSRYSPYGVYRCKGEDRWCSIAVTSEEEWLSFCHTVGNPPWTLLPEFTTMNGRIVHAADLDRHIEDWTRDKDPESIMKMLEETGVAAGIVQKGRDLDSDPQLAYRNFYSELDHPGLGSITYGGMPVEFSDTEWEMRRAPYLGEHNEQLLIKEIGMNPDDYSKLKADGVFE